MRHHNPKSVSYFRHYRGQKVTSPYSKPYDFSRAKPTTKYIQVLNYLSNNPNSKRVDIIKTLWPNYSPYTPNPSYKGYQTKLFSNLLYFDYIDYNKNYQYSITPKGLKLVQSTINHSN